MALERGKYRNVDCRILWIFRALPSQTFVNQAIQKEMFTYNLWKNYLTPDCVNLLQGIIM